MIWIRLQPFTRDNVLRVPSNPGVYALNDSQGRIIYIGGSDNLKRRLLEHLPQNEQDNPCIKQYATQFQYLVVYNWQDEETRLIRQYSPSCNRT